MPLAVVRSRALLGMVAPEVQVEIHLANGIPSFQIVGLPRAEVRESKDRVRAAILQLGFDFPSRRITVNLAPADLPKESGRFDLPIALGILCATGQLPPDQVDRFEAVGELSLTGDVRPVRGAIAMALAVRRAGQNRTLLLPRDNADEAALINGLAFRGIHSLADAALLLGAKLPAQQSPAGQPPAPIRRSSSSGPIINPPAASRAPPPGPRRHNRADRPDMADVCGQASAKRVLEIAATGTHSLLMIGPPGAGKSMLAQRLASILPPLDDDEAAEVAALASLRGRFEPHHWGERPFREPHHSASMPALVGGGSQPRPGEISLAHRGVLFLDEFPEFARPVLEALREPLESGRITVSRALRQLDFPARFQLVAAMNPCRCGYLGERDGRCRCSTEEVRQYQGRLSGPLLDRIDLQIWIQALPAHRLFAPRDGERSDTIRARVSAALARQRQRQQSPNAHLPDHQLPAICELDIDGRKLLQDTAVTLELSGRAVNRALKVARSIADLAGSDRIQADHVSEALMYRSGFPQRTPADC